MRAGVCRRTRVSRGAAAVEFVFIAPILILVIYGIVQYGFLLSFRQSLSQATAEGARAAAVASPIAAAPYDPVSEAENAVAGALGSSWRCDSASDSLTRAGAHVGTCQVTPSGACDQVVGTCSYTVRVTYDYGAHPLVPRIIAPVPGTLSYQSEAQGNSVDPATAAGVS